MRAPPSSCRATLALASLMVVALLLFCSTASQARPHGPRSRRYEEQQQEENDAQILAAADAAASPSPSALPTTLALLLAPAPAPSKPAGVLQEAGRKGAAAAPSPSANPAAISHNDAADDDNEEEEEEASGDDEEATSDDGAGDGAAEQSSADEPKTDAEVAETVASAYRAPSAAAEPPSVPGGQPKKVRFLARGANKEIDQSEVDASSLSGEKGSFVFYGRYCGPGWTDKQDRPGIDPVDEACHAHDTCYGKAREANPPSHKIRRAAAECSCDKALVSSLKEFKKNKTEQAAATKAAKRAANDMIELFDIKCPISVAGAILRPPSPESAPVGGDGKKW